MADRKIKALVDTVIERSTDDSLSFCHNQTNLS